MIALSTSWYSTERIDVRKMLEQVVACGVQGIEIGYNFTREQLRELEAQLPETKLTVVSVHNFSPAPDPVRGRFFTDLYRISSLQEPERLKAVEYTKRTIDTAQRFKARVVVVHAGTVESVTEDSRRLLQSYSRNAGTADEHYRLRAEFIKQRQATRKPYIDAAIKSLQEIMAYAKGLGIYIGLETRYYPNEIPNFEEVGELLALFYDQGMRYWHDMGHAEVNHRLGLAVHAEFLKRYASQLIGFHLHDVIDIHDHLAPFTGSIDFSFLKPYIGTDAIKVIEAHSPATVDQIKKAVEFLSNIP